jgi:hypothetical protein
MGCSLDAPRRRRVRPRRATPVHDLRGRPVNRLSRIDVHHRVIGACVPITSTDQPALTDRAHHASSSGEPYRRARPPGSCRCTGTCCAGPVLPRDGDGVASRRRACSRGPRALWRAAGLCPSASSSRSCRPAPRRLAPPSAEADRAADAPAVRVDRLLSKRGDGATARAFFSRAVSFGRRPGEVTTDRAPIYPRVLDDVCAECPARPGAVRERGHGSRSGPAQSEAGTDRVRRHRVTRDDRAIGLGSSGIRRHCFLARSCPVAPWLSATNGTATAAGRH